jgi:hypothetical protein
MLRRAAIPALLAVTLAAHAGCERPASRAPTGKSRGNGKTRGGKGPWHPGQGTPQPGPQQGGWQPAPTAQQPTPPPPPPPSTSSPWGLPFPLPQLGWPLPSTGAPSSGTGAPPPAVPSLGTADALPIQMVDMGWMRQRAQLVLSELVAALPAQKRSMVQGIPLYADPTVGEVNAFAACDERGAALMAITDSLLEVMAYSARTRATDEIFGTRLFDGYVEIVAQNYSPGSPLPRPSAAFFDPSRDVDPRKLARQVVLFDGQLAFVVGHELAHHHLAHTGCAAGGAGGLGRILSRAVPIFSQGAEAGSDIEGTYNLLAAGSRRSANAYNEDGATLSLAFFAGLDKLTPTKILFAFENSHPHPSIRLPLVKQAAATWRQTGGNPPPTVAF